MKVILTGVTGFVGREVLEQLLNNSPEVTSVVALARRELQQPVLHPKLKYIVIQDFLNYTEKQRQEFQDADACIWSLGSPYFHDMQEARKVSIDYTVAGMKALSEARSTDRTQPFHFVYVSGHFVEKDQNKTLWFLPGLRKMRGEVELAVIDFERKSNGRLEGYIARPAIVLPKNGGFLGALKRMLIPSNVRVEDLAAALICAAVRGNHDRMLENDHLNKASVVVADMFSDERDPEYKLQNASKRPG